ncbi:MAG: lytic transglycosylase [Marinilabiliales bacterium]|nr:MAG: lytic transglycosylase [Marinilabiliales bacterium]
MKISLIVLLAAFFAFSGHAVYGSLDYGGEADKDTTYSKISEKNDPIISVIDSLILLKVFETSTFSVNTDELNTYDYDSETIPEFPDLIYECRLAELDAQTPIALDYNQMVQRYIDVYVKKRRNQLSRMLGLSELYYPLFEEELDKRQLPLELKHLAVVESALNPMAVSSSGAVGLWQFLYNSGKMFNLNVSSYIDERRDPIKSTKAACDYLEYLFRIFNDWQLALAAYNGGPGTVRNAIIRSGGKTSFWEIRPYLPKQTQNYVPAFIAVNYAMNYTTEHNIFPVAPKVFYRETDTILISGAVHFEAIQKILGIPLETIQYLNPEYKRNYIPYTGKEEHLSLPKDKIAAFLEHENDIYSYSPLQENYISSCKKAGKKENKEKLVHIVNKGEYIHGIAIKYKCTIEDIKVWNNMATNYIYTGKKLNIWVDHQLASEIELARLEEMHEKMDGHYIFYTVQKGDTLWKIAEKFKDTSVVDLMQVNNIENENILSPGTKLKIYLAAN